MTRKPVSTFGRILGATACVACLATAVFADESQMVTVEFDGQDSLTGMILASTVDTIRILTPAMGIVTIPAEGATCIGAACPSAAHVSSAEATIQLTNSPEVSAPAAEPLEIKYKEYLIASDESAYKPPLLGGQVTLKQGDVTVEGRLTGLEPDAYILEVANFGAMRVPATYECIGTRCPSN